MIKKQIFIEYIQHASQHLIFWEAHRAYGLKEFNYMIRMYLVKALLDPHNTDLNELNSSKKKKEWKRKKKKKRRERRKEKNRLQNQEKETAFIQVPWVLELENQA